ncbi:MAG: hypothetical protein HYV27_02955 [Candidatus Hydrogenedentes bacterium]|nr:hypothetical protein [Candidatus Hydrogenedentota bacterium]
MTTTDRTGIIFFAILLALYLTGNALLMQRFSILEECALVLRDESTKTVADVERALEHRIQSKGPVRSSKDDPNLLEVNLILQPTSAFHLWVVYVPESQELEGYGLTYFASEPVDLETGAGAGPRPFSDWPMSAMSLATVVLWGIALYSGPQPPGWKRPLTWALRLIGWLALVPLALVDLFYSMHFGLLLF